MLSFGMMMDVFLLVFGVAWCRTMFGRMRSDLKEFRAADDPSDRTALILMWSATALIALFVLNFTVGLVSQFL